MNFAARVAIACAVLGSSGCAAIRREPVPAAPIPIAAEDPILETVVRGWQNAVADRRGLRAGAVLKLSGPEGAERLNQNVVLARPGRFRMEFLSFLVTAAVLVVDDERYDYFQSLPRIRDSGPVYPHLLYDIAGVPLTLTQAVHFLLGGPPPRRGLHPGAGLRLADGVVQVDLHDGRGRLARRLAFDAEGRLLRAEDFGPGGQLQWRVGYDRYRQVGAQPFAHTIDFEFPRLSSRASVAFRTVELDPETPDGVFRLDVPDEVSATP
ncbi:MAG: hypothetical protein HKP30_10605 [Myxococcales bacterium]|nr:hypothetical protein [Myxococcales bacterium]